MQSLHANLSQVQYVQKSPATLHALVPPMVELVTNECMPASLTLPAAENGQAGTSQVSLG